MTGPLLLAVATLLVLAGAWLAVVQLALDDPLDRVLGGATAAGCQILLSSLAVGALLHRFERGPLLAANAGWDLLLVAGLAARTGIRRPRLWGGLRVVPVLRSLEWWQWALILLAGAALLWRLVLALVLPQFAYDSITYHLTAVADWVQRGRIEPNPYSTCCARYPQNGEVMAAWPAVFLHRDALVDLPQLAFALVGALATAAIASWAGVSARGAAAAGALFALTPIVLAQANVAYVDVTHTAMLLVSLALLVRFLDAGAFSIGRRPRVGRPRWPLLALAGLAAGFALGTKQVGIVSAAVLVALAAAHLLRAALAKRLSWSSACGGLLLFAGCTVLVGGYWYVRNWIDVGNPVWPGDVHVLGVHIFEGPRRLREVLTPPPRGDEAWWLEVGRSWYHDLAFWGQHAYSYQQRLGGLGPLWSWLGWAFLAAFVLLVTRRKPHVALNLVLPLAVVFALQPYRWWSRFTVYLAAAGAVAVVFVIEHLEGRRALKAAAAIAAVCLAAAGAAIASWTVDPGGHGRSLSAPQTLRLVGAAGDRRTLGRLFFPEYRWLDYTPSGARIGVEASADSIRFLYPLFGARFEHRVVLLPAVRTQLGRMLDYVVVGAGGGYDEALAAPRSHFRRVSSVRGVHVYRRES